MAAPKKGKATPSRLSADQREHLRVAEYRARDSARRQAGTAKALYARAAWREACFFAMSALEEIGRGLELQRFQEHGEAHEIAGLILFLRQHHEKAMMGTVPTLVFNDEARARHGRHPVTEVFRIEPVRYLAEAPHEWMRLKNACLYEDLPGAVSGSQAPSAPTVGREHAYLMIVGALEALAQMHAPHFSYRSTVSHGPLDDELLSRAAQRIEDEVVAFRDDHFAAADIDRLEYLGNPARFEQLRLAVRGERTRRFGPKNARKAKADSGKPG